MKFLSQFFMISLLLFHFSLQAEITFDDYVTLKSALHEAFVELKPQGNHILMINPGNEDVMLEAEYIHASYSNLLVDGVMSHNVFLLGGYLRQPYMSLDGIAITACHELGHGFGGFPFKKSGYSAEGQSDYYATKVCLPILFKYLQPKQTEEEMLDIIHPDALAKCQMLSDEASFKFCIRAMVALEGHISYYRYVENQYATYGESSSLVATELNPSDYYYPEAQCRLDTSMNGVLGLDRPVCWYPASISSL